MEKILLIGAGGHAKTIVDTIERLGTYEIVGFADENNIDSEVYRGYKVLGSDRDCDDLFSRGIKYAFLQSAIWVKQISAGDCMKSIIGQVLFFR